MPRSSTGRKRPGVGFARLRIRPLQRKPHARLATSHHWMLDGRNQLPPRPGHTTREPQRGADLEENVGVRRHPVILRPARLSLATDPDTAPRHVGLGPPNVQAFIRRASRMADKTSWTKPLASMTYGDCIVGTAWLEVGTAVVRAPFGVSDGRSVGRARSGMESTRAGARPSRGGHRRDREDRTGRGHAL